MGRRAEVGGQEALEEAVLGEPVDERVVAATLHVGHHVDDLGHARRAVGRVEAPEGKRDQRPTGRRRRVGQDRAPAVVHGRRLARHRRVGLEVAASQQPAEPVDVLEHRVGDVAAVERRRRPRRRGARSCRRARRRGTRRPRTSGAAAGREPLRGDLGEVEDRAQQLGDVALDRVERDPGARVPRGRRGELRQRDAAPALVRLGDPRRAAVGAARRGADVEDLIGVAERHVQRRQLAGPTVGSAEPGRGDEEVQQRRLLAAAGDEHVATGAGTGEQWLGRPRGQHRRERRVDGVPAVGQHVGPGLRGQRMTGGDHAPRMRHARTLRRQWTAAASDGAASSGSSASSSEASSRTWSAAGSPSTSAPARTRSPRSRRPPGTRCAGRPRTHARTRGAVAAGAGPPARGRDGSRPSGGSRRPPAAPCGG